MIRALGQELEFPKLALEEENSEMYHWTDD
jgi:hypothetical protein